MRDFIFKEWKEEAGFIKEKKARNKSFIRGMNDQVEVKRVFYFVLSNCFTILPKEFSSIKGASFASNCGDSLSASILDNN